MDVVGGKRVKRGLKPWHVATGMLKSELYGWLKQERPTEESGDPFLPGYCHFPQLPEEFFKQLTAEQLVTKVTKVVKGYRKPEWVCIRERNEALDTRVYARAAASQFGMDRFSKWKWKELEAQVQAALQASAGVAKPAAAPTLPAEAFRAILPDDPYL